MFRWWCSEPVPPYICILKHTHKHFKHSFYKIPHRSLIYGSATRSKTPRQLNLYQGSHLISPKVNVWISVQWNTWINVWLVQAKLPNTCSGIPTHALPGHKLVSHTKSRDEISIPLGSRLSHVAPRFQGDVIQHWRRCVPLSIVLVIFGELRRSGSSHGRW